MCDLQRVRCISSRPNCEWISCTSAIPSSCPVKLARTNMSHFVQIHDKHKRNATQGTHADVSVMGCIKCSRAKRPWFKWTPEHVLLSVSYCLANAARAFQLRLGSNDPTQSTTEPNALRIKHGLRNLSPAKRFRGKRENVWCSVNRFLCNSDIQRNAVQDGACSFWAWSA